MTTAEGPGGVRCSLCRHRLGNSETVTCRACVADVRADLRAVRAAYQLLPGLLGALGSNAPDPAGRTVAPEPPLPGGTILALLAPGSGADERRRAWLRDPTKDPAWDQDDRPSDPPSVAHELGRWEDDWRRLRDEPAAAAPASVAAAVAYLHARTPWAATQHPSFPEFVADLRALQRKLQIATSTDDRPERAGVPCFECGGDLERRWTKHGLDDDRTCRRCGRVYDQTAYLLAVRADLENAR